MPEQANQLVAEAGRFIRNRWSTRPTLGVILGTGSGGVADRLEIEETIAYEEIPGFVKSTATGHRGRLICGRFAGLPTLAMQGRFHRYEGWSFEQTVFPTRVMIELGVQGLVVTNAAGGVDPRMQQGDLLVLESHIDLLSYWPGNAISDGQCPPPTHDSDATSHTTVAGRTASAPPTTDLVTQRPNPRGDSAYCPRWRELALAAARKQNVTARSGVYLALPGPNYETRAEYRLVRRLGGDVVGMSTVPEVMIASLAGIPVLAISVVTNVAKPDALETTTGEAVVHAAKDVEATLAAVIRDSVEAYWK